MKMAQLNATLCFEIKDIPAETITVYHDRAEVKRTLKLDLKKGQHVIIIQNVSSVIEHQSIKVNIEGSAVIQDVQFIEYPVNTIESSNNDIAKFEQEKNQLETKKNNTEDTIHVLKKRLEILDGVASQIGQNACVSCGHKTIPVTQAFLLSNESMNNLTTFLDYYVDHASKLKREMRNCEKELNNYKEKLESVERSLSQHRCRIEYDTHKRRIKIVLDAKFADMTKLILSYQVYCVSWKPIYDIRATTSGSMYNESNKVQILYFGLIEQNSGEDWHNASFILSTSTPCVGGEIPLLPTINASFQRQMSSIGRHQNSIATRKKPNSNGSEEDMGFSSFEYNDLTDAAALQRMTNAYTASEHEQNHLQNYEILPSTRFPIASASTVLSDGIYYKVQIATLDFDPVITHEVIPSKTTSAFITATVLNKSSFPLLSGVANVYLNNSYTSTINLKTVLPGNEFKCFLGVDPLIIVDYKPCIKTNEQVGFMTKSSLCTLEQIVSLNNANVVQNAVIVVRESIPKAIDEKIKVCVISPDVKTSRTDARLNKDQHLEWVTTLAPGEQRDLCIKYTVEYPTNENVTYYTQRQNMLPP